MKLIPKFEKSNKDYFYKPNTSKHFPSSVRHWNNVIYVFNKNTLKTIPNVSKYVIKLIKGYFTLYNRRLERKFRFKRIFNKRRRLSSNKFYLSNGEFKHTNNKVIITLYLFNRQKKIIFSRLKRVYLDQLYQNKKYIGKSMFKYKPKTKSTLKKILRNKSRNKSTLKKMLLNKINTISLRVLNKLEDINYKKTEIVRILKIVENKNNKTKYYKAVSYYINRFYKKLLKKNTRKIAKYVYYKQLIYINKSKLNYTYLQYLKNFLQMFFNKNVEFNFVNIKKFYYNSDILSEAMLLKITRRRSRLLKKLNKLTDKIKIWKTKHFILKKPGILQTKKNLNKRKSYLFNKFIVNKLKYRHVSGFRLEAKGRLTRRYTASRSLYKFKYKGNLRNINSSIKNLSTVMLKGNLKSNLQYSKMNSKTRIGSFGLKGWVSGI